jgi:hypothetical protein
MATAIKITINQGMLARFQQKIKDHPKKAMKAVAGAINDTAKHEASLISKRIREEVNIKKADVDKYIHTTRATPERLAATVTLEKSKKIPLEYFSGRQTALGLTYRIAKSGGRTLVPHGFLAKGGSLGGHAFVRKFKNETKGKGSGPLVGRLGIRKLEGPSAWGVFEKHRMKKEIHDDAAEYLQNRINHRLEHTV